MLNIAVIVITFILVKIAMNNTNKASSEILKRQLVPCSKLDWVGPVDNRPSTEKPHHFI